MLEGFKKVCETAFERGGVERGWCHLDGQKQSMTEFPQSFKRLDLGSRSDGILRGG